MTRRLGPVPCLALIAALGCSQATTELLPGRPADASRALDAAPSDAARSDAARPDGQRCDDHTCACDDGIDQDDDALIDGLDAECTGPYDDDEASFGTGTDDGTLPACQGCFWREAQPPAHTASSDPAPSNACSRPLDCALDPSASIAPSDSCGGCSADGACGDACLPSTPNGCDCFGCCEASLPEGTIHVLLAGTCSLRDVSDPTKCPRCTPSPDCQNPCGPCELCGTRKRRDLPRECRGRPSDEPLNTCDEGQRVCDEQTPCPETYYCQLGCCRIIVL